MRWAEPISKSQNIKHGEARIAGLDAIRAVAFLFLVPLVVQSYALVAAMDESRFSSPLFGADGVIWILLQIFCADVGFILLSVAFGASLKLHGLRQNLRQRKTADQQRRRLLALLALGLVLMFGLGADSTLVALGVIGLLAFAAMAWDSRKQLNIGLACIVVSALVFAATAELLAARMPEAMIEYGFGDMRLPVITDPESLRRAQSGWVDQLLARLRPASLLMNSIVALQLALQGLGLALIGAALAARGIFSGNLAASRHVMIMLVGLGGGVPLSLVGILMAVSQAWEPPFLMGFGGLIKGAGSLLLGAAAAAFVLLMFKRRWLHRTRRVLTRLGRSTLTWSVLGLLFLSFYYYGYGLGHAGTGDRVTMMRFVIPIWILICGLSYFWLKYFHYGPMEWVLRYWVNGTRPPLARLDKLFAP